MASDAVALLFFAVGLFLFCTVAMLLAAARFPRGRATWDGGRKPGVTLRRSGTKTWTRHPRD
jgi:hypothetical protein